MNWVGGIFRAINGANIKVTGSLIQENSGVYGPIFMIESRAVIECTNCTIRSNFGILEGLFLVTSSGVLRIHDSQIYQNYCIEDVLGKIMLSVEPSIINNTEIYGNKVIENTNLPSEISNI